MSITVENILGIIKIINDRKRDNQISIPLSKEFTPNLTLGIDSLAFALNAKIEDVEPVVDKMITFGILELVDEKKHFNSGRKGIKKIRLKNEDAS